MAFPTAYGQDPGGVVNNKDPTVETSSSAGSVNQSPGIGLFTVEVRDKNKEADFVELQVEITAGPIALASTHLVSQAEVAASAPASYAMGWNVWNSGGANDGRLTFVYKHAYTAAGTYTWRFSVRDDAAGSLFQFDPALDITVALNLAITVEPLPVKLDGTQDTGARWGGWIADPGESLVHASNYVKVTNTGVTAAQGFVLAFSGSSFVGATTSSESVGINSNVRFLWWEDTTPSPSAPSQAPVGTLTCSTGTGASTSGSTAPAFTALGAIIYVRYCIVQIPDPSADQTYKQSFTVTAV